MAVRQKESKATRNRKQHRHCLIEQIFCLSYCFLLILAEEICHRHDRRKVETKLEFVNNLTITVILNHYITFTPANIKTCIYSAHSNGVPRYWVCAPETLRSAIHRHECNFFAERVLGGGIFLKRFLLSPNQESSNFCESGAKL